MYTSTPLQGTAACYRTTTPVKTGHLRYIRSTAVFVYSVYYSSSKDQYSYVLQVHVGFYTYLGQRINIYTFTTAVAQQEDSASVHIPTYCTTAAVVALHCCTCVTRWKKSFPFLSFCVVGVLTYTLYSSSIIPYCCHAVSSWTAAPIKSYEYNTKTWKLEGVTRYRTTKTGGCTALHIIRSMHQGTAAAAVRRSSYSICDAGTVCRT